MRRTFRISAGLFAIGGLGLAMMAGFSLLTGPAGPPDSGSVSVGTGDPPNYGYGPNVVEISQGATVYFGWVTGPHSVTSVDSVFDSGVKEGGTYFHTFEEDGVYYFFCTVHATAEQATEENVQAGNLMVGKIVVGDPDAPTPTPTLPKLTPTSTMFPPTPTSTMFPLTPTSTLPTLTYDLFEGWTQIESWGGGGLSDDAIDVCLSDTVWAAFAHYDGSNWDQRFPDPPLPAFNTLTELTPGERYWLFVVESQLWGPGQSCFDAPPP